MRTIWKVNVAEAIKAQGVTGNPVIQLPQSAEVLTVQYQRGDLCLWAEVDTEAPIVGRTVYIKGTGEPLLDVPFRASYVGTVQDQAGLYVWHVYVSR